MSPGELNVGVGMTYNYANPKKTFTLDASISPFVEHEDLFQQTHE